MTSASVKAAATLAILAGIVFAVVLPLYLGRIGMNPVYGIRIRKAFASEENRFRINRYGAGALMLWSAAVAAAAVACLCLPPDCVLTFAKASFLSIVVPLAAVILYGRKL